jgi:hypothetical protein
MLDEHINNLKKNIDSTREQLKGALQAIYVSPNPNPRNNDDNLSSKKYIGLTSISLTASAGNKMTGQVNSAGKKLESNINKVLDKAKQDLSKNISKHAGKDLGVATVRTFLEFEKKAYKTIQDGFSELGSISSGVMREGLANLHNGLKIGGSNQIEVPSKEWKSANDYFNDNSVNKADLLFRAELSKAEETLLSKAGIPEIAGSKVSLATAFPGVPSPDKMTEGDKKFYAENLEVYNKLVDVQPFNEQGLLAKDIGIDASIIAFSSYQGGNFNSAYTAQGIASTMLDIATGTLPVISTGRDIYEALTGKNLLTGVNLTNLERSLALVGIASLGASHFTKVVSVVAGNLPEFTRVVSRVGLTLKVPDVVAGGAVKIADSAAKLGFKNADDIKRNTGVIERWASHFNVRKIEDAANINAKMIEKGMEPAYKSGTKVIEFETSAAVSWVRVHGQANQARPWMMREVDIKDLSGKQIAEKFNIKDIPTMISRVDVPAGTTIRIGSVGRNSFGTAEGAIQYEIRMPNDDFVPAEWFTKMGDL